MKQVSRNRQHKAEQEQDETQAKEVRDEQLSEETEELLKDIECCLAEAVADLDEKAQAKADWEKIGADWENSAKDRDARSERWYAQQAWLEKYRQFATVDCCGQIVPDFGDE